MNKIWSGILILILIVSGFVGIISFTSEQAEAEGLSNSSWPMFRGGPKHSGRSPYNTSHVDGGEKWSFDTGHKVRSSPAVGSDGTLYVGSGKYLYALNPDGTEIWNFSTNNEVDSSPAIGSDGTIYVGSDDHKLYALNPDGTERWNFTTNDSVGSSPVISKDGGVYFGSDDGNLYALNQDGTARWSFSTDREVRSSPAIGSDGTIYVGCGDSNLYAVNSNGTEKWNFSTGRDLIDSRAVYSSPAIGRDGTIYIGSRDSKLYAVNPNGTEKWNFSTGNRVDSSPAIGDDGTIYVGSDDSCLYAVYPNGTKRWQFSSIGGFVRSGSPAIGSDGTIYLGSGDFDLYAVNQDGTERWSFSTGNFIYSSPAIGSNGRVFIGSYDDNFYAIGKTMPPSAPRELDFKIDDGQVDLSWQPPSDDGGSSITDYYIYRGTNNTDLRHYEEVKGGTTSYTDSNLSKGQTYYYQVTALNEAYESNRSTMFTATLFTVPSPPQNLQSDVEDGKVNLTWKPPLNNGGRNIIRYELYRGNDIGNLTSYESIAPDNTSYVDTDLTKGQTYYYEVSAVTSVGEGNRSSLVNATLSEEEDNNGGEETPGFTVPILLVGIFLVIIYKRSETSRRYRR